MGRQIGRGSLCTSGENLLTYVSVGAWETPETRLCRNQVGVMHGSDDQVKLQRLKEALLSETDQQKRSALKREIVLTEALLRFGRASPEE